MNLSELNEYMGAFEGALSSRALIVPPQAKRILLAVDGSNQDATAIAIAAECAKRLKTKLSVIAGQNKGQTAAEHELALRTCKLLHVKYGVTATPVTSDEKTPAKQILAASRLEASDLVVMPAPYLQELEDLADESLSSPVDVVVAEARAAVLLVREPLEQPLVCFEHITLPIGMSTGSTPKAAGWAFELAGGDTTLSLLAFAGAALPEEAGAEVSPERAAELLTRAGQKAAGALCAAAQKHALTSGAEVVFSNEEPPAVPFLLQLLKKKASLTVVSAPADRTSDAYHAVHDLALGSRYPILIART